MTELLYYIFVFPLEGILGFLLEFIFGKIPSYGASIIILALFVNVFLLKIFILTDKKAEFEAERKKRLDSRIKAWKSVYKKAKLFAFTQTLYRQNHYHPIFALSALGGLAVQIPFFYAMYFVVKNAELKGVPFLWISDLSAPDLILGVHLLPILMTIISLVNVWIVAKDKGARIQGIVIALIFLVLLYQMPSALVLYWTTNMAFSLIRAVVAKWRKGAESNEKNASDSANRAESTNICHSEHSEESQKNRDSSVVSLPQNDNVRENAESSTYRKISYYAIFCITFLICVFNPYALYSTDIRQFDLAQTFPQLCALFGFFVVISFVAIYFVGFIPQRFAKIPAFVFSFLLLVGLIYSFALMSDYGAMDNFILQNAPEFGAFQVLEFIAVAVLVIAIVTFVLKRLLRAMQIALATLFIVSGVNATNIALKVAESAPDSAKIAESSKIAESNSDSALDSATNPPPRLPYQSELFSYSKTQKNIVVIVLDMFSGSHTPYILEQFPRFKSELDGFTLFPNTISTTNSTIHSIATLMGGEYYATYNMNARKQNLAKEIDKAFIDTANAFAEENFSVSLMAFVGSDIKTITPLLNSKVFALDAWSGAFFDYYVKRENLSEAIKENEAKNGKFVQGVRLISFGLFRFVPNAFHTIIYKEGKWLSSGDRHITSSYSSIGHSANFYAFTHNMSADSAKPTFKFFHSMMTHTPYGMYFDGKKCEFYNKKGAWSDYPHQVSMTFPKARKKREFYQHFDTEACALKYLAHYLELLKSAGIYDNTQIFVVSDHSGNDSINIPLLDKDKTRPDALLMFKDFNARGSLKIDNRLMANYDIASIFCANLPRGCPSVGQNILENYPPNREIIHTIPSAWQLERHRKDEWIITKAYKVRTNIYEAKNWVDISDSAIVNVKK